MLLIKTDYMIFHRRNNTGIPTVVERFMPERGSEWLKGFFDTIIAIVTPYVKGKVILDAGCGSGYEDDVWLKNGAKHIDAYDISDKALEFARANYKGSVTFNKSDFNEQGFKKNVYDIAVSIEVIEHLEKHEFYLKNIYNALKKDGLLFISTPNSTHSKANNEFHTKEFNYEEFVEFLENNGFSIVQSFGLSNNNVSVASSKLLPAFVVPLIKKIPIYSLLIKLFFKPQELKASDAADMIFICRK